MFTRKDDLLSVAALAKSVVYNQGVRQALLDAQTRRRMDFLRDGVWDKFRLLINFMEAYV